MKYLLLASVVFLVSCGPATMTNFGQVAPQVLEECSRLAQLPERNLNMSEVERYWTKDRLDYVKCASKHKELSTVVKERTMK